MCSAGDGLGREMSRQLYAHGYNLLLVDDSPYALQEVKSQLQEQGAFLAQAPSRAGVFRKLQGYFQSLHSPTADVSSAVKAMSTSPAMNINTKDPTTTVTVTSMTERIKARRRRWWHLSNNNGTDTRTEKSVLTIRQPVDITQNRPSIHLIVTDYGKLTAPFTVLKEIKKLNLEDKVDYTFDLQKYSLNLKVFHFEF